MRVERTARNGGAGAAAADGASGVGALFPGVAGCATARIGAASDADAVSAADCLRKRRRAGKRLRRLGMAAWGGKRRDLSGIEARC